MSHNNEFEEKTLIKFMKSKNSDLTKRSTHRSNNFKYSFVSSIIKQYIENDLKYV